MQEDEKRRAGLLFFPGDPALVAQKRKAHKASQDFNRLYEDQTEERNAILKEILGSFGEGSFIQGPVTFHYGCHTFIGHHCFVNFNFTVQDDGEVHIGNHCDFGPNVTIVTPVHPMLANERLVLTDKEGRSRRLCYAKPVIVGNNCWLGAGVILCPGVTVGDNCVIGAGSVVTRDIPAGSFAAGNPCRVIRTLTEADSIFHKPEVLGDFLAPPAASCPAEENTKRNTEENAHGAAYRTAQGTAYRTAQDTAQNTAPGDAHGDANGATHRDGHKT